ncbi:Na()-translocating NADH-quinone reductase subunit C,Na()-translocating NADH-quinone reductase subunit C,Na -transporting NADH:ubiquinone oxidoreductase, subunit NqrC,NADH:ubiquinone oxidoreductase, Na()-translocating, C subunit,FMN-binding domain [Chlamydia serpentis]|uniref:Na(+)-translocating NADH-quinone reductase subunit C n=1 Tax=Chlamydia serpentis TaxID=1967782 RepID=A0A2R8FAV9_9CHLA|nr:NADH:ubiquinone reductase (Na(+)-transporting) subunit C [Chlamydia serpentis]SPN73563.1 Na()-translocating NADH-quinone reductase subunit C,Na()-translocating NADH-quinone reductase subunit C,Na -transporting NADH:ubiquinone oxidoreductase, subunit NqrC,NADH:ubiquinone oxidoreductase, Na()-translocating, C subunit,FMN-binding domain [Chlamydia serpentis]
MSKDSPKISNYTNQTWYIISFVLGLSLFAGLLLSTVYYVLSPIQEQAANFDRNKQMLLAARVLDFKGRFQIQDKKEWVPALFDKKTQLLQVAKGKAPMVSHPELEAYAQRFVRPLLTDKQGKVFSFEEKHLDVVEFFEKYQESSPCQQPLLPFFVILDNTPRTQNMSGSEISKDLSAVQALIFPISGFGLWGPIHGYLGIKNDGDTVLGTAWYQQGETPGLGANITNPEWQEQFYGKKIFLEGPSGTTDFATTTLGLEVIKGSVRTTFGNSPKALSAIDGISGATLTCNGVTEAYMQSLACYRQLLIHFSSLNNANKQPNDK